MSPPNSFDDNKPVKSKRGRKALAVSEGHIDVTGRTHIMTVRRSNPPAPKKKTTTPKSIKQNNNNNYCKRCEQNDEYIDILNDRIGKLESLVDRLTNTTKPPQPIIPQAPNFINMGTEELLNLSNQIGGVLFERFEMQNQLQLQASMATPITTLTPPISPFCESAEFTDWSFPLPLPTFPQYQ